jgi:hypothetical protein
VALCLCCWAPAIAWGGVHQTCPVTAAELRFLQPFAAGCKGDHPPGSSSSPTLFCEPPPCAGGCTQPAFCNLETRQCEQCAPRYCCATMNSSVALRRLAESLPPEQRAHPETSASTWLDRLSGTVLLFKRPCPRGYHCDEGRVDDYLNATATDSPDRGYIAARDSHCFAREHQCSAAQGCPEGTDKPVGSASKVWPFVLSLLWLALALVSRKSYAWVRLTRRRASRGLHASLLIDEERAAVPPPAPPPDVRSTVAWVTGAVSAAIFSSPYQLSRTLSGGGIVPDDIARDRLTMQFLESGTHEPSSSSSGSIVPDEGTASLEAKAAALAVEGGKSTGLDLTFRELSLSLPNGHKILQGVSGGLKSGRLCAIMGPSVRAGALDSIYPNSPYTD